MRDLSSRDVRIPWFLRGVTILECVVVFAAAGGLFFQPDFVQDVWPWAITPFNSRFTGAIYFAALIPLLVLAWTALWSPGRVVLWMILTFTSTVALAMILHTEPFDWGRPGTWVFWALYLFLPLNSAVFLYMLRGVPVRGTSQAGGRDQAVLTVLAVILGTYGLLLLLRPEPAASFWPWEVDAFHGRIYASAFLTPAVGALVVARRGARSERSVLGLTLLTLGLLSIVAVAWASAAAAPERKVDYGDPGTLIFIGLNVAITLAAALLIWSVGRVTRRRSW